MVGVPILYGTSFSRNRFLGNDALMYFPNYNLILSILPLGKEMIKYILLWNRYFFIHMACPFIRERNDHILITGR
jgi:hypothetical protein